MTLMETLYDEHEKIAAFIETLQQKCVALMEHGTFDAQEFYDAIRHIREYADKEHHQKEERLLFRAMVKELGPAAENLVQHGMLVEHDMARLTVSELEKAVHVYEETKSADAKLDVLAHTMEYVYLLRRHIAKENGAVYPFAERHLKPETMQKLEEDFKAGRSFEG